MSVMKVESLYNHQMRIQTVLKNALQRRVANIFVPWMALKKKKKEEKNAKGSKFGKGKKKKAAAPSTTSIASAPA